MDILKQSLMTCFAAILFAASYVHPVRGDEGNKLTYFTFSQPVELPGMTLPAGSYAFKLLDTAGNRNVVQVFNKDLTHLYGTFVTIADYRPQASDKSVIRFSETEKGGPPAIKEWFYPGDTYGFEFVYPKSRAVELAKASNQPVPSMADNMTSNIAKDAGPTKQNASSQQQSNASQQANVEAMEKTSVMAEQPSGDEVELAEVFILVPAATTAAQPTTHSVTTEYGTAADKLPKTASLLPLLGLLGVGLVMAGLLFRMLLRRAAS